MKNPNHNRYLKRRKLFRTVFGIFSLSGIMFAFQACYGTPQDFGLDILIRGKVISAISKNAIPGIKVVINHSGQYSNTADDGTFNIYCESQQEYNVIFSDADGSQNGVYQPCDTTVLRSEQAEEIILNIELK